MGTEENKIQKFRILFHNYGVLWLSKNIDISHLKISARYLSIFYMVAIKKKEAILMQLQCMYKIFSFSSYTLFMPAQIYTHTLVFVLCFKIAALCV